MSVVSNVEKIKPLEGDAHLIRFQSLNEKGWKIYLSSQNALYTLPEGTAPLDEATATSCAKLILPRLLQGTTQIEDRSLKPRELSKLSKAGIKLPFQLSCQKLCTQKMILNAIRNFDLSVMTDLTNAIELEHRTQVIKELAQTEPHLIYALIFYILEKNQNFDKKIEDLCYSFYADLPYASDRVPMWRLMDACRRARADGKPSFVTRENVIHLAMFFSGFDVRVIELLKEKGCLVDGRWHQLLPKEFAAVFGAAPEMLKALGATDEEMVDLVSHNVCVPGMRHVINDFNRICQNHELEDKLCFHSFKVRQLEENSSPSRRNSVQLFKFVIEKQKDILEKHPYLIVTICGSAILSNKDKIEMIQCLLAQYPEKDLSQYFNHNKNGTPLTWAILSGGNTALIRLLFDHGANMENRVHLAAFAANLDALTILAEKGADLTERSPTGQTPFDVLIDELPSLDSIRSHTQEEQLNQLFRAMADFFIQNNYPYTLTPEKDRTLLDFLAKSYSGDLIVKFFTNYPIPLSLLFQHKDCWLFAKELARLIPVAKARGEDFSQARIVHHQCEWPLLPFAINEHCAELVEALLEAGVSCTDRFQGKSPRMLAKQKVSSSKKEKAAEPILKMIEAKIPPNDDERTPFHEAAAHGDIDACEAFIAQGGYLPLDINGRTPLHEAVIHGHVGLCKILYRALEKQKIQFPPIERQSVSDRVYRRSEAAGHETVGILNRNYTIGGSLLAHAVVSGNEAMMKWAWDNDLQNAINLESRSRLRYKGDREKEQVFDVLYHIACHYDLKMFQRACEWLYRDETVKNCAQEEPLVIAAVRQDLPMAAWVCQINASAGQKAGAEALKIAVHNKDLPMLKLLIAQGALEDPRRYEAISDVCYQDDAEMFLIFFDAIKYDLTAVVAPFMSQILIHQQHNILRAMIAKSAHLSDAEAKQVIDGMKSIFGEIKNVPASLLFYLIQHAKSAADWDKHLTLVKKIFDSYPKELAELIRPENFLKQVFEEILEKFQKKLAREEGIVERLFALLLKVKTKTQVALYFNALQRGCPFDDLKVALEIQGQVPPVALFKTLSKEEKIRWLTYFAVSGFRGGFEHAWDTIKEENDPDLLFHALKSLEMLGVTIPLKKVESRLSHFFDYSDEKVRIQALKAMVSVQPDPKCEYCKGILKAELKRENSKAAVLALLQLIGNYENTDREMIDRVIELSNSNDQEVRVQAAFTLSKMYDDKALRRAMAIVKSHDWDFMDEYFGDDRKCFPGAWWMFISRPEFQDSRSGMLRRINDSFAFIHRDRIASEVNRRMQIFEKNPSAFPEVAKLADEMAQIPRISRYVSIPFYYPTAPGNYLLRGLKARKGAALFDESIRDLIRKGCGSSDLTRFDEEFTFATWSKVGHMFATHDADYVKNYFTEAQGCLILIDPAYYNDQYRRGFARTENEDGINNVFYRGVPKNAIKLIYMSQSFKNDIELLYGNRNIDDKFKSRLTSNAFTDCSIDELLQFRKHLREEIEPLIGENGPVSIHNRVHYRQFYHAIRYIDSEAQVAIGIQDMLKRDGVKGITRQDIDQETLRAAMAREVIAEEVGRDLFMSQDEMLTKLTDEEFKNKLPEIFTLLHLDKLPFKTTRARHGTYETGGKVTAYDHTMEVIAGKFGGFGLHTDLGFDPHRSRRLLRLAALYHYAGLSPRDLVSRSAAVAKDQMQQHMKLQGITPIDAHLVSMLILHNEHFGEYLRGKISFEEFEKRLTEAYQQLPKDSALSKAEFTKMLWALFTARASTLRKVQESQQHYQTFLDFPNLDCSNLKWVRTLRENILGPMPAVPPRAMAIAALWECDDETFKQKAAQLVNNKAFPYDFSAFVSSRAGHGHKADGSEVNLLEHTLDVICGNFGGFGLNTHLTITGMSAFRIRKILRIAALFHDSGKIHGRDGHIERSAEIAADSLSKDKAAWNIDEQDIQLIKQLILHNDVFGQFLKARSEINHMQLLEALSKAYASQSLPVYEVDFRKLLFALWIADSSTLKVVNRERGHLYRPLHRDLDSLDYDVLGRVYTLKYDILEGQEDLPYMSEVSPGIYRGGQPNVEGLMKLDGLGIKTLICFRRDENLLARARQMDIDVFHFPIDGNNTADYEAKVLDFLKVAKNANKPLFIFCEHGADRTGFMSAVYRYVIEGATLNAAIQELKQFKSHQSHRLQPQLIACLKGLDVNKLRRELGLSDRLSIL